jgi:hypothetical protein
VFRHRIDRQCATCKRIFWIKISKAATGRGTYCSAECRRPKDPIVRFWSRVNKDGPIIRPELGPCWPWKRSTSSSGYGHFGLSDANGLRVTIDAHVYSWKLHNGPLPKGLHVLHHCDYKPCCRPDHLFAGTNADNVSDMTAKGRNYRPPRIERAPAALYRGTRCHTARLNDDLVREIRWRWEAGGITQMELARIYGVKQPTISSLILRRAWKHVD